MGEAASSPILRKPSAPLHTARLPCSPMPDDPTTPAARIAARSRRLRTAGIAGAGALLAGFSRLAAGRMAHHDGGAAATVAATAAPAAAAPSGSTAQDDVF